MLRWEITDRNQQVLATLFDRSGGQVTLERNGGRSAQVTIALDDPAALKALVPLGRLIRVWMDGLENPLFIGRLTQPTFGDAAGNGEGGATVTLNALDPKSHLEKCFTKGLAATPYTDLDQSEIAARLIESANANRHGIVRGNLPLTVERDRTYFDGTQVWEALVQLSEVIDGMDFEFAPVAATDGTMVRFNTFAEQGTLRPAIFEYGFGRHNVGGFTYEPAGYDVVNKATAVGAFIASDLGAGLAPARVAESPASQALYGGVFESFEVFPDVSGTIDRSNTTLENKALEVVRRNAFAIEYFDIVTPPEPGSEGWGDGLDFTGERFGTPPAFGTDYWIGDRITARIRRNIKVDITGRVEAATVSEDDQGNVSVTTTCAPVAIDAADVVLDLPTTVWLSEIEPLV
jgi:hypothetical protein